MSRHRSAILTDSDKTNYIIQHTKLVIVSLSLKQLIYQNTKLHKADKHKITKSQYSYIKTVQHWATSSTSWLLFIFCLQQVYKLYLSDRKASGACEVYLVERGFVLYCTARVSTVCFTFDRMLSRPCSYLDIKGRKSRPHTRKPSRMYCEPFGISTIFKEKEMLTRQADRGKPIYLVTAHVLNIWPNTTRAGFDPETIHTEFVLDNFVLGQVLLRELQFLLQILSKHSCCNI